MEKEQLFLIKYYFTYNGIWQTMEACHHMLAIDEKQAVEKLADLCIKHDMLCSIISVEEWNSFTSSS